MKCIIKYYINIILVVLSLQSYSQFIVNNGDITINDNASFIINNMNIENNGNIHDNSNSLFEIIGTTQISLSGTNLILYKIKLNNSGGYLLSNPLTINNSLIFTNGIITSSATNELIIIDNASVTSASATSHVNGPVIKNGDDDFTFPIGDGTLYRPIGISGLDAPEIFTAEYKHENPNTDGYDTSARAIELNNVSSMEYWNLSRSGAVDAYVTLYWSSSVGINDYTQLVVSHWNGTTWEYISTNVPSGTNSAGSITSTNKLTSFSPFAIASLTADNPLPIKLLSFYAKYNTSQTTLYWITQSELNNEYFEVERSIDGSNFVSLGKINGAINSIVKNEYSFTDFLPLAVCYYRIKQIDIDGNYSYSNIIYVNREYPETLNFYFNNNYLWFDIPYEIEYNYTIQNSIGQVLFSGNISNSNKIYIGHLNEGLYTITLNLKNNISPQMIYKIIKTK